MGSTMRGEAGAGGMRGLCGRKCSEMYITPDECSLLRCLMCGGGGVGQHTGALRDWNIAPVYLESSAGLLPLCMAHKMHQAECR